MRYCHHSEAEHSRKFGRVAIWNREKIAILIAMLVWVADLALIIYGEYLLTIIEVFLTSPVILQVAYG